nr:retrovirus-related Pol polyprotein from transposon TNT 1-94 [Tanacetum cinerariifolium]
MAGEYTSQPPQPPIASPEVPQMVSSVKLPILKKGEYIIWTLKMEQYLAHTDYALWEEILNGNSVVHMTKDEAGNEIEVPPLDNKDLEQIDQDDLEEMDLKWLSVITVIEEGTLPEIADQPRIQGTGVEMLGMQGTKEEIMVKGLQKRLGTYDWSYQVEEEATNFSLMAFTLNPSSSSSLNSEVQSCSKQRMQSYEQLKTLFDEQREKLSKANIEIIEVLDIREEEVTENVFDNRSSDEENSLANDMFKKGKRYHVVPSPLTGNYMPPKPDLSFAGLDDFIYKFKISETVTSLAKDAPETSTASVEKPKEDRSSAPLIPDWETDSDNDNVFIPEPIPAKIDFLNAFESVKHLKPIDSVKHINPIKSVKTAEQTEKSKHFSLNRMAKKSVLPTNVGKGTGHRERKPVWNHIQRINHQNKFAPTAVFTRSEAVSVVKGNKVTAVKTSAGCVWRPRVNDIDQIFKDNRWICTCVDYGHPQQALKNKGIVDSGCFRHMTGNKAYLTDYQEINDGGFVAFSSSRASIDKFNLWHMRLGYVNFKTMNKLVKENLVRGLPSKIFENDHTGVACQQEAVNTACYVLNRALVTKTHNKTPYELLNGKTPRLDFIRPFGCPITILNTLDALRKFKGKADEGFWFVSIGNQTEKNAGPQDTNGNADDKATDDTGSETIKEPVNKEDQAYRDKLDRLMSQEKEAGDVGTPLDRKVDFNNMESSTIVSLIPTYMVHLDHPKDEIFKDPKLAVQTRRMAKKSSRAHALVNYIHKQRRTNHKDYENCLFAYFLSQMEPKKNVWRLVDLPYEKKAIRTKWVYKNKKDERSIVVRNKARLVAQGHRQEEGIDCDERRLSMVYTKLPEPVSTPIETQKPLVKDKEAADVDVHIYRSTIGSLMYLMASRPDIMFAVCAYSRFQVTPNLTHLHDVKRIFSDYAGSNLDGKSTIRDLKFVDQYNMVACLERTEANYVFHQIVDFLFTCSINYALTSFDLPLSKVNISGSGEDSMEHQDDLTDVVPPTPHNSPLSGGHTSGSDEGRPNLLELMNILTKLSNRVLALEEAKTTQDKVITKLKLRVRRLEKKRKARILQPMKRKLFKDRVETSTNKILGEDASKHGRNDDKTEKLNLTDGADTKVLLEDKGSGEKGGSTADQVSTARPEVSTVTLSTPPTTTTIFGDEDLTIAQTLIKFRGEKAKEKGVAFRDVEEPLRLTRSTTTLQPLPTIDPKDKELAQRIYEEELAELDKAQKERQEQEKATIAALTEEFDEIQARMEADHGLALKHKTFEELQKLYKKEQTWIDDFVPIYFKKEEKKSVEPESKGKKGKRIKKL